MLWLSSGRHWRVIAASAAAAAAATRGLRCTDEQPVLRSAQR